MPSAIASSQYKYRRSRLNNPPRADRHTAAEDEMLCCPCGVTIKKSSYRTHCYRSDEHVDYMIYLCMLRDVEIDVQVNESLRLQQAEAEERRKVKRAVRTVS